MFAQTIFAAAILAITAPVLAPEAEKLNDRAMEHFDAGAWAAAVDGFYAAYHALPDPRRDLAGREQLMGSMRYTLLTDFDETQAAGPLCRLQSILQEHLDGLAAAFPADPTNVYLRNTRANLAKVGEQLAAFAPDACAPAPAPVPALAPVPSPIATPVPSPNVTPSPPPPAPLVLPTPARKGPPKQWIAAAVVLPLGVVAWGGFAVVAANHRQALLYGQALHIKLQTCACATSAVETLQELVTKTRRQERTMLALGVAGAALTTAGTVLLIHGAVKRRRTRVALDLQGHQFGLLVTRKF